MATSFNPLTSEASRSASGASAEQPASTLNAAAGSSQIVSKDAFLKLLVAQIKNQNPLNPADSVQFLTQLAQFSELEQMMGVRTEIQTLRQDMEKTTTPVEKTGTPA